MVASHRFAEHVGEVRLELEASSLAELLVEAGRALAELFSDEPASATGEPERCVVDAEDRETLLVAWLNELVFLSETRHAVFSEFVVEECSDRRLVARVRGAPATHLRTPVKAATLHDLRVETREDGGIRARVVLDV